MNMEMYELWTLAELHGQPYAHTNIVDIVNLLTPLHSHSYVLQDQLSS
jgi:hypothetical protein